MAQNRGTYIIVPSLDYSPDSIGLGDIITKSTNPKSRIGRLDLKTLPNRYTVKDVKLGTSGSRDAGLWSTFLKTITGDAAPATVEETGKGYTAAELETRLPDQQEFQEGLNGSEILQVLDRLPGRKKRVYVVTAVKIAKGLKAPSETSPLEAHSGVMVSSSAVRIGTEISKGPSVASPDIVFAYQLSVVEQRKSIFGKKTTKSKVFSSSDAIF
ncbi:hypothetical protein BCR34DRAFT_34989 [Clohesyomyces aquaticus]|uniref:Uncharacterized protein n=1 Tax=Clohesyomyces aquaticus TaxID=1231657 RepID=A0A1Y1Z7F7_9PLEO|nr:hypothetical protein BCR34DRAFT_34989 [Clohesyomyces aquaticus]